MNEMCGMLRTVEAHSELRAQGMYTSSWGWRMSEVQDTSGSTASTACVHCRFTPTPGEWPMPHYGGPCDSPQIRKLWEVDLQQVCWLCIL